MTDIAGDTRRLAARISDELHGPAVYAANLVHVTSQLAVHVGTPDGHGLTTVEVSARLMEIAREGVAADHVDRRLVAILEES